MIEDCWSFCEICDKTDRNHRLRFMGAARLRKSSDQ